MVRTELVINAGETETVVSGETQDTATVSNAGTFSNAGTNTAGGQELTTTATDIDATTSTLNRVRELTTRSANTLSVASGTTESIASGEFVRRSISNAGTVANAGTVQAGVQPRTRDIDAGDVTTTRVRELGSVAKDIDVSAAAITVTNILSAVASDIDTQTATLSRSRELVANGVDIDDGTAPLLIGVTLSATATDADSGEGITLALIVPETTAIPRTQPVQTIQDILERTEGVWRAEEPIVKNYWDEAQSERGQGADQPPKLYVWQPASESHDKFSLDGDHSDDTVTIEVLVYSLNETEAKRYAADVRGLLQLYINDNADVTEYTEIKPVNTNDYREQNNRRATEQYVLSVEVEMRTLQETGDLGET
jgi:hypothetical protein